MQIKLTPETEEEKANFGDAKEVVHEGVRDYFLVGLRKDTDGDIVDFYDWRGKHHFLLGALTYYYEVINDERRQKNPVQAMTNKSHQANRPKNVPNLQVIGQDKKESPQLNVIPAEVVPAEVEIIDGDDEKIGKKVEYRETTD